CPVFAAPPMNLLSPEFATINDELSGVAIRRRGSLPVGTVPTTWRVASSIRLSVASPELSTITLLAWAAGEKKPVAATSSAPAATVAVKPGRKNLRMKTHFGEQPSL